MNREVFIAALAVAAGMVAAPARAQVSYNNPNGSGLGGGFLELMVTGRVPGRSTAAQAQPSRAIRQADPMTGGRDPYWGGQDPFAEPAPARGRQRFTALPNDAGVSQISRSPRGEFLRQEVAYAGGEAPGTIVVDTPSKFLYHVLPGGRAIRYGIGVGRPGFTWAGIKSITMKKEWPDWRPPPEMLKRRPDLPRFMEGGPENPLGARALYLGSSLYRIHGTNEPHTIGQNVSSGCIRMMNDDVSHLYDQVRVGTRVKVI